jgi:putative peptide zinc metalloprotease protein
VLSVPQQQVLVVVALLVAGGSMAIRQLWPVTAALASLVLLALLPTPGAATVLPLVVCAVAVLAASALNVVLRQPPEQRPHPLLRTIWVAPALVLVVVGGMFVPASIAQPSLQLASLATDPGISAPQVPVLRAEVLSELPHDPSAFTQGLELVDGVLYEGTGLKGRSQLRELDPATGAERRAVPLPDQLFGEGVSVVGDRIWQLTWRDGVVLEWDRSTLTLRRLVAVNGEGWGLCHDGVRLIRSDGTDRLHFHDSVSFAEIGSVRVSLRGASVSRLNELECVNGQVWANVWGTDELLRIDPASGLVTAVVNAAALLDPQRRIHPDAVLNGIAHWGNDEYLLTGKLWPLSFHVRFVPM